VTDAQTLTAMLAVNINNEHLYRARVDVDDCTVEMSIHGYYYMHIKLTLNADGSITENMNDDDCIETHESVAAYIDQMQRYYAGELSC